MLCNNNNPDAQCYAIISLWLTLCGVAGYSTFVSVCLTSNITEVCKDTDTRNELIVYLAAALSILSVALWSIYVIKYTNCIPKKVSVPLESPTEAHPQNRERSDTLNSNSLYQSLMHQNGDTPPALRALKESAAELII